MKWHSLENDDKCTKRHKTEDLYYTLTGYTVTRSSRYKTQYIMTNWMNDKRYTIITHNNISTRDLYAGNIYVSCKSQEWYLHCYMIFCLLNKVSSTSCELWIINRTNIIIIIIKIFVLLGTKFQFEWVNGCCLAPTQQYFSYIMARTSEFSMKWW